MNDLDWKRIGNVLAFGLILFGISWGLNWTTGSTGTAAVKAALNGVLLWALGQMQQTGRISISRDALGEFKK